MVPDRVAFHEFMKSHSIKEAADYYGVSKTLICGWCRLYELPRRSFRYKDLPSKLTSRQAEIVTGSLLGDACLERQDTTRSNSRFIEKHGMAQREYLLWKHKELEPFSGTITYGTEEPRSLRGKETHYCKFSSGKHPLFTILEKEWYDEDRVKRLPKRLTITPLALAVWYFDDGHLASGNWPGAWFFTNGFTYPEVKRLIDIISNDFGINECSIHSSGKNRGSMPELFVKKACVGKLLELVSPFLPCECLRYKITPGGLL